MVSRNKPHPLRWLHRRLLRIFMLLLVTTTTFLPFISTETPGVHRNFSQNSVSNAPRREAAAPPIHRQIFSGGLLQKSTRLWVLPSAHSLWDPGPPLFTLSLDVWPSLLLSVTLLCFFLSCVSITASLLHDAVLSDVCAQYFWRKTRNEILDPPETLNSGIYFQQGWSQSHFLLIGSYVTASFRNGVLHDTSTLRSTAMICWCNHCSKAESSNYTGDGPHRHQLIALIPRADAFFFKHQPQTYLHLAEPPLKYINGLRVANPEHRHNCPTPAPSRYSKRTLKPLKRRRSHPDFDPGPLIHSPVLTGCPTGRDAASISIRRT